MSKNAMLAVQLALTGDTGRKADGRETRGRRELNHWTVSSDDPTQALKMIKVNKNKNKCINKKEQSLHHIFVQGTIQNQTWSLPIDLCGKL